MPRWKVPGSPVSWIATCFAGVKTKQADGLGNLVRQGSAERRLASAWGAVDQCQPGGAHLFILTLGPLDFLKLSHLEMVNLAACKLKASLYVGKQVLLQAHLEDQRLPARVP